MFELVILSVICFAGAYATFLWREGRRDDVLFGAFCRKALGRSDRESPLISPGALRPRACARHIGLPDTNVEPALRLP